MNELEIAHRLRIMAAEMDDLAEEMRKTKWKTPVWGKRAAQIKYGALDSREWAAQIERENAS